MKQLITHPFKPMVSSHRCNGFISSTKKMKINSLTIIPKPLQAKSRYQYTTCTCGVSQVLPMQKNQTDGWHTQIKHELHTATGSIQAWLQISKCAIVEL